MVLAPVDNFCFVQFTYPALFFFWFPMIGTSSIDRAQVSRLFTRGQRYTLRNVVLNKTKTMDNIQKIVIVAQLLL
jgi:hypothetical protein